ncbi:hypothetical protein Csa_015646 [Cucumis sativus]|uniref:Uncharacterized protein n=1 Tax=Cucumis sativus TaxID=3659 RepID=A0A0A0K9N6_CUCSA|nr:hypothetical protein Csa_015646 [Cucumis sativus]
MALKRKEKKAFGDSKANCDHPSSHNPFYTFGVDISQLEIETAIRNRRRTNNCQFEKFQQILLRLHSKLLFLFTTFQSWRTTLSMIRLKEKRNSNLPIPSSSPLFLRQFSIPPSMQVKLLTLLET